MNVIVFNCLLQASFRETCDSLAFVQTCTLQAVFVIALVQEVDLNLPWLLKSKRAAVLYMHHHDGTRKRGYEPVLEITTRKLYTCRHVDLHRKHAQASNKVRANATRRAID